MPSQRHQPHNHFKLSVHKLHRGIVHTPLRKILPHGYEFGSTPSSSNLSSLLADFQQQDLPVKYYFPAICRFHVVFQFAM
jgi:hypothetical protein